MNRIHTTLTFPHDPEDAVRFYTSLFPHSEILSTTRFTHAELTALQRQLDDLPPDQIPGPAGAIRTIRFTLDGTEFTAVNGGAYFEFSEAASIYVRCDSQEDIDQLWEALKEDGETFPCGWVRDRYGLSWQVAPSFLDDVLEQAPTQVADRVMIAMYGMQKLDLAALRAAAAA